MCSLVLVLILALLGVGLTQAPALGAGTDRHPDQAVCEQITSGFALVPITATTLRSSGCGRPDTAQEVATVPVAADAVLPRWRGSVDLYRPGVYAVQQTWHWCVAAGVQIMRNIVHRVANRSTTQQRRYFRYMRGHDRYAIPVRHGVDPAGWAAGLRRFVDPRYRLVTSGSFTSALRSAVRNLRRTNLPVGIAVAHGNHAWVLTGFSATADPAKTKNFKVTSVRVTGPLWGRQNRRYGYDMRPNSRLTRKQLRSFFTRWHYAPIRMAWEGRFVSIQPIP